MHANDLKVYQTVLFTYMAYLCFMKFGSITTMWFSMQRSACTCRLISIQNGVVACLVQRVWLVLVGYLSEVGSNTHQRLPLIHWARNLPRFGQYWLVPGTDSSVIYIRKFVHSESN